MNATVSVSRAIWIGILGVTWSSIAVLAGGLGAVVVYGRHAGLTGWPALLAFLLPFVVGWCWWYIASSRWWALGAQPSRGPRGVRQAGRREPARVAAGSALPPQRSGAVEPAAAGRRGAPASSSSCGLRRLHCLVPPSRRQPRAAEPQSVTPPSRHVPRKRCTSRWRSVRAGSARLGSVPVPPPVEREVGAPPRVAVPASVANVGASPLGPGSAPSRRRVLRLSVSPPFVSVVVLGAGLFLYTLARPHGLHS